VVSPGVGGLAHAVAHDRLDEQVVVHFLILLGPYVIKRCWQPCQRSCALLSCGCQALALESDRARIRSDRCQMPISALSATHALTTRSAPRPP
jgi:hypothetical protein